MCSNFSKYKIVFFKFLCLIPVPRYWVVCCGRCWCVVGGWCRGWLGHPCFVLRRITDYTLTATAVWLVYFVWNGTWGTLCELWSTWPSAFASATTKKSFAWHRHKRERMIIQMWMTPQTIRLMLQNKCTNRRCGKNFIQKRNFFWHLNFLIFMMCAIWGTLIKPKNCPNHAHSCQNYPKSVVFEDATRTMICCIEESQCSVSSWLVLFLCVCARLGLSCQTSWQHLSVPRPAGWCSGAVQSPSTR